MTILTDLRQVCSRHFIAVVAIVCGSGVHSVAYAFPKVKLVTTAVDPRINDRFYILPGIGKSPVGEKRLNIRLLLCISVVDATRADGIL